MAGQGMKVQNRRYVGRFETFGYVLYNSANSFNIGKYTDRFLFDVLKIDLGWLFVLNNINSVWDVINDTFIGVMVDRTRTRWGKFKPYLVITAVFSGILGSLYWMQPLFFDTDPQNRNKAVVFLLLAMTSELNGTFRGLAERGMTATITPHPDDRTRLITAARFYGNFLPLGASNIVMGLLIDAINHKIIGFTLKNTFVFMGVMTSLISAMLALYFFIVVKERVVQSVNPPGIKDSLRTIIGNRPLLIIALAQLGGAFQLQGGMDNYYIDVLGAASINQIVGIPGAPISPMSYTFIPFLRRHFSTKALWIIGGDIIDWTMGLVFFFGIIGGTGANGWYNKKSRMIPILMIQEASYMCFYGARKVIPVEIENEAFDYSEWKYGYRT
ncbi:MAG: MFS transporter, partial [Oscillospiraceae bacterium]|nr:MFS transporter [Oscillospiraceae bacterium]